LARNKVADRLLALKAAYQSTKDRISFSEEEFIKAVEDWEVIPVRGGAVLIKDEQIHACINPEGFGRWLSRSVLRKTLGMVLEKHGRAVTSTATEEGARFVQRLGFQKKEEKEGITIWELKRQSELV
jgi:hypothetical protein